MKVPKETSAENLRWAPPFPCKLRLLVWAPSKVLSWEFTPRPPFPEESQTLPSNWPRTMGSGVHGIEKAATKGGQLNNSI